MRHHGNQIELGLLFDAFIPKASENTSHLMVNSFELGFGPHWRIGRSVVAGKRIRPECEPVPVIKWEIKERGEHCHGQFGGDGLRPVKCLMQWQGPEQFLRPLPDQYLIARKIGRCCNGGNCLPLACMPWGVAGNEAACLTVVNSDAAKLGCGGEGFVVQFNSLDILKACDGPIGPVRTPRAVVNGPLPPQPAEIGSPSVLLEK